MQSKSGGYNPYSLPGKPPVVRQPRPKRPRYVAPPPGCPRKLDRVTRSKNALILALLVFVIAFVACLAVIIVFLPNIFPNTTTKQTEITLQVASTLNNRTYDPKLEDPTTYPAILMNTSFCGYLIEAVKSVTEVTKCQAYDYSDASPGVKSTMNVTAPLGTNTEETLFNDISSAIVDYATTVKDWDVLQSNIKLIPWVASLAVRQAVQFHLLFCVIYLLHMIV